MKSFITATALILLAGGILHAQQAAMKPDVISYQGMVTSSDGTPFANGEYPITVTLYGDEGGTIKVWQDTYTTEIRGGVFSIYLGSGTVALPAPSQMDKALWVGTRIAGGEELRPLTRLSSSPYAINVPDNAITTSKLADGAVTEDKVNLDYISGVSVNGKKIAINGKVLNIQAGKDIEINYDEMSQSLVIGAPVNINREKDENDRAVQGTPQDAWRMTGDGINVFTGALSPPLATDFIGTSNAFNIPFTIKVNGERAMYYQPNGVLTPSIIGGHVSNTAAPSGDGNIIAGGGTAGFPNTINGRYHVIGGGAGNSIVNAGSVFSVIGGGQNNVVGSGTALANYSIIGSGFNNRITGNLATIVGGRDNFVSAEYGSVGGGIGNIVNGRIGTAAGGDGNEVHALDAAIGGGYHNKIISSGEYGTIAGGSTNTINGQYNVIGGGLTNNVLNAGSFGGTIAGGQSNQIGTTVALANYAAIGGGLLNQVTATYGTIAGGRSSTVSAVHGSVGGGISNVIGTNAPLSTIAGGDGNQISTPDAAIGGGYHNQIVSNGYAAAIPGGENLIAQSYGQTVIGVLNIPKGTRSPGSAPNNEPILIVGNGLQGSQSNAFEVSYNGQSTVFGLSSPLGQAVLGRTGTDNVIYAWGNVGANGIPLCSVFGATVVPRGTGWYQITLNTIDANGNPVPINCGSVTAILTRQSGPIGAWNGSCSTISVSQIVNNVFDVYIANPGCGPVSESFTFKVTGRP